MIALKDMSVWSDLLVICKVLICLIRKLMITYSDAFSQDWEYLIKQIIKEINKLKNNIMSEKILTAWRLSSNDVLIIINTVEIKEQLKHSKYWLSAVNQITKINCHKFTVLMHEVCMFTLDYNKQDTVIKKLLNQN